MQLDTFINAVGHWGNAGCGKASWISPDPDGWRGGDGQGTVKPPDAPQEQAFDVIDEVTLDLQARVGSSGPK
jgi:hypothetical protein